MLSKSLRNLRPTISKRFNSHGHAAAPKDSPFNNKYSFNIDPPQVHKYWNYRNGSVLFLFVPIYVGVGYLAQYTSSHLDGYEGLLGFANGEHSPLNEIKFGESQQLKKD